MRSVAPRARWVNGSEVPARAWLPASNFRNMRTHRAVRLGIAVLSAVALVASGASPVVALDPDPVRTLVGLSGPFGVAVHPGDGSVLRGQPQAAASTRLSPCSRRARPPTTRRGLSRAWRTPRMWRSSRGREMSRSRQLRRTPSTCSTAGCDLVEGILVAVELALGSGVRPQRQLVRDVVPRRPTSTCSARGDGPPRGDRQHRLSQWGWLSIPAPVTSTSGTGRCGTVTVFNRRAPGHRLRQAVDRCWGRWPSRRSAGTAGASTSRT